MRQLLLSATPFAIEHALLAAAHMGHKRLVQLFIATGIDPDLALSYAARAGAQDLVSRLIDEGTAVNPRLKPSGRYMNDRMSPLTAAAAGGHEFVVQQLIMKGAELETSTLLSATSNGHVQITELILQERPYGVETLSEALIPAVEAGYTSIVKLLLDHGADIEVHDHWHVRPLHAAAPRQS